MAKATIEQVIALDAVAYAEAMQKVIVEAAGDSTKLTEGLNALNASRLKSAQATMDKEAKAKQDTLDKSKADVDALRAHIIETVGKAWTTGKLSEQLSLIPVEALRSVSFRVERADDGTVNEPLVLMGMVAVKRPTSAGNGGGNAGGSPLTVNGKEFATAAAAKRELLPDKAEQGMNRASIISALKTSGHTVAE
jgi:hypothetical protein